MRGHNFRSAPPSVSTIPFSFTSSFTVPPTDTRTHTRAKFHNYILQIQNCHISTADLLRKDMVNNNNNSTSNTTTTTSSTHQEYSQAASQGSVGFTLGPLPIYPIPRDTVPYTYDKLQSIRNRDAEFATVSEIEIMTNLMKQAKMSIPKASYDNSTFPNVYSALGVLSSHMGDTNTNDNNDVNNYPNPGSIINIPVKLMDTIGGRHGCFSLTNLTINLPSESDFPCRIHVIHETHVDKIDRTNCTVSSSSSCGSNPAQNSNSNKQNVLSIENIIQQKLFNGSSCSSRVSLADNQQQPVYNHSTHINVIQHIKSLKALRGTYGVIISDRAVLTAVLADAFTSGTLGWCSVVRIREIRNEDRFNRNDNSCEKSKKNSGKCVPYQLMSLEMVKEEILSSVSLLLNDNENKNLPHSTSSTNTTQTSTATASDGTMPHTIDNSASNLANPTRDEPIITPQRTLPSYFPVNALSILNMAVVEDHRLPLHPLLIHTITSMIRQLHIDLFPSVLRGDGGYLPFWRPRRSGYGIHMSVNNGAPLQSVGRNHIQRHKIDVYLQPLIDVMKTSGLLAVPCDISFTRRSSAEVHSLSEKEENSLNENSRSPAYTTTFSPIDMDYVLDDAPIRMGELYKEHIEYIEDISSHGPHSKSGTSDNGVYNYAKDSISSHVSQLQSTVRELTDLELCGIRRASPVVPQSQQSADTSHAKSSYLFTASDETSIKQLHQDLLLCIAHLAADIGSPSLLDAVLHTFATLYNGTVKRSSMRLSLSIDSDISDSSDITSAAATSCISGDCADESGESQTLMYVNEVKHSDLDVDDDETFSGLFLEAVAFGYLNAAHAGYIQSYRLSHSHIPQMNSESATDDRRFISEAPFPTTPIHLTAHEYLDQYTARRSLPIADLLDIIKEHLIPIDYYCSKTDAAIAALPSTLWSASAYWKLALCRNLPLNHSPVLYKNTLEPAADVRSYKTISCPISPGEAWAFLTVNAVQKRARDLEDTLRPLRWKIIDEYNAIAVGGGVNTARAQEALVISERRDIIQPLLDFFFLEDLSGICSSGGYESIVSGSSIERNTTREGEGDMLLPTSLGGPLSNSVILQSKALGASVDIIVKNNNAELCDSTLSHVAHTLDQVDASMSLLLSAFVTSIRTLLSCDAFFDHAKVRSSCTSLARSSSLLYNNTEILKKAVVSMEVINEVGEVVEKKPQPRQENVLIATPLISIFTKDEEDMITKLQTTFFNDIIRATVVPKLLQENTNNISYEHISSSSDFSNRHTHYRTVDLLIASLQELVHFHRILVREDFSANKANRIGKLIKSYNNNNNNSNNNNSNDATGHVVKDLHHEVNNQSHSSVDFIDEFTKSDKIINDSSFRGDTTNTADSVGYSDLNGTQTVKDEINNNNNNSGRDINTNEDDDDDDDLYSFSSTPKNRQIKADDNVVSHNNNDSIPTKDIRSDIIVPNNYSDSDQYTPTEGKDDIVDTCVGDVPTTYGTSSSSTEGTTSFDPDNNNINNNNNGVSEQLGLDITNNLISELLLSSGIRLPCKAMGYFSTIPLHPSASFIQLLCGLPTGMNGALGEVGTNNNNNNNICIMDAIFRHFYCSYNITTSAASTGNNNNNNNNKLEVGEDPTTQHNPQLFSISNCRAPLLGHFVTLCADIDSLQEELNDLFYDKAGDGSGIAVFPPIISDTSDTPCNNTTTTTTTVGSSDYSIDGNILQASQTSSEVKNRQLLSPLPLPTMTMVSKYAKPLVIAIGTEVYGVDKFFNRNNNNNNNNTSHNINTHDLLFSSECFSPEAFSLLFDAARKQEDAELCLVLREVRANLFY